MSLFCCFILKSRPLVSFDENSDEPCEYVVEKLVVKKVPIRNFATAEDLKDINRKRLQFDTPETTDEKDKCLTFASYSQIIPSAANYPTQCVSETCVEHSEVTKYAATLAETNVSTSFITDDSPKEELTSGRRRQLEECNLKWTTAEIHKKPVMPVSPTIIESPRFTGETIKLDASVKETIELLGTQKPAIRRRCIARDPDTGQIKDMFNNGALDVVKLDEIYSGTSNASVKVNKLQQVTQTDSKLKQQSTDGMKWKIIIKHKNGKDQDSRSCTSAEIRPSMDR